MDERLQGILEPIPGELPCGEDLSFSAEFDRIQEARREDDPTVDYGEWQTTLKLADWPEVVACCTSLLKERSKDLRLAAWLSEGLVKTAGLGGLADGLKIMAGLIERFGAGMYPQAEDGDQEQRVGTLSWYVIRMSQLVRQIPITRAASAQFSMNDYEAGRHFQIQLQRNQEQQDAAETRVTLEKFSAAVAKTDKKLYSKWITDTERGLLMLAELKSASEQLFAQDSPSYGPLTESLEAIRERLRAIANDLGILAAASEPVEKKASAEPETSVTPLFNRTIKNREHALELLREVAAFFRNTEPHSPVAYLADKAARWGEMPLHSWLRNVVKDHGTLSHIEELLGLKMDPDSERAD